MFRGMFSRKEVNPQEQEQSTRGDSSRESGNTQDGSRGNRRRAITITRRGTEKGAETLAESSKAAGKQPENSFNSGQDDQQSTIKEYYKPTRRSSVRSSVSSFDVDLDYVPPPIPPPIPRPTFEPPTRHDSGYSSSTEYEGAERTNQDFTNQQLRNKEARLETDVEHSTDLRARHKAQREIQKIHEETRNSKRGFFKGKLQNSYIQLLNGMETIATEVTSAIEPKVSETPNLQSDTGYKIVGDKRDEDKAKRTQANQYTIINANSIFQRANEHALSRQPEFRRVEEALYKEDVEGVKKHLGEMRGRFEADRSEMRAHGIVDIETGKVRLNNGKTLDLCKIKSIKSEENIDIVDHPSIERDHSYPPFLTAESSSFSPPRVTLTTDTGGLSPTSKPPTHKRRVSDAASESNISFVSELPTHGSKEKTWKVELADNQHEIVANADTQPVHRTENLINFQTGRIELANGTRINLDDIDWGKSKEDKPTELHVKTSKEKLYKHGSTIDLKEAGKPLDAAALNNRQKYEAALKQYRVAQMNLLEEVVQKGSASLSDARAVIAGIHTNDAGLEKVTNNLADLKRPDSSETKYNYHELARGVIRDATNSLLHVHQMELNIASRNFANALKSSAEADLQQTKKDFGRLDDTNTAKTIEGRHNGPNSGIELQNNTDLPLYDKLKAEEPEFIAEKTRLETQRTELAGQLERLNRQLTETDTQNTDLKNESARLHKADVSLQKRETELRGKAVPYEANQAELRGKYTSLEKQQATLREQDSQLEEQQTTLREQAPSPTNQEGSSTTTEPQGTRAKIDELQGQRDTLKRQMDELQGQRDTLKRQIDELQGPLTEVQKQRKDIATQQGEIQKQQKAIWDDPNWKLRESIRGKHQDIVKKCEEQEQKAAKLAALEKKLAESKSPYTKNSYLLRKVAESEAADNWIDVKHYVRSMERPKSYPTDNQLIKARKAYENTRIDHIRQAHSQYIQYGDKNELRLALYEERFHAAVMRHNISRTTYALSNKVTEISSKGVKTTKDIRRLKSVRKMHLDDIITDPTELSHEHKALNQKYQELYDKKMYRIKPAEFTPQPTSVEAAVENAANFTLYARERARYEVQKLIDNTEDLTDKGKMIDRRGKLEQDFVDRFTKSYSEERTRAHELERVKLARKAMNDFAWKMFAMSIVTNFQMAHNTFDQSVDSTLNSIIRSGTRTA